MIQSDPKHKGKYRVVSESLNKKGQHKNLGGNLTKAEAHKRLAAVEWFKHHPTSAHKG